MTNEFCKFEGGQGCVIVLPLVRKAVKSLHLETLCSFNCPRQTGVKDIVEGNGHGDPNSSLDEAV